MATKKRCRASQGRDTPKLSPESAKAVTDAYEGAIAQFERCPRRDTRAIRASALIVQLESYVDDLKDPEQAVAARLDQVERADQKRRATVLKKRTLAQLEARQLAERQKPAFLAIGQFFGAAIMSLAAMLLVYRLVGLKGAKSHTGWNKRQRARTNFDAFPMRGCTVNLLDDAARCAPAARYWYPDTAGHKATSHIWSAAYQAVQELVTGLLTQGVPQDPLAPPSGPHAPSPDSLKPIVNPRGTPDFGFRDLILHG